MSEASDSKSPSQMKAQRINIIIPTEPVRNKTQETLRLNPFSLVSRKRKQLCGRPSHVGQSKRLKWAWKTPDSLLLFCFKQKTVLGNTFHTFRIGGLFQGLSSYRCRCWSSLGALLVWRWDGPLHDARHMTGRGGELLRESGVGTHPTLGSSGPAPPLSFSLTSLLFSFGWLCLRVSLLLNQGPISPKQTAAKLAGKALGSSFFIHIQNCSFKKKKIP